MQRYFVSSKEKNTLILKDSDLHHIKNVMRNKVGDTIECIYNEELYICRITSLTEPKVEIISKKEENNELETDITLAIALVKEQKMDFILQKVTELGIKQIIPLKMERSIIKLDEKKLNKKIERWQNICKEASEQSKRNNIPIIKNLLNINDLIKENFDMKLVCSTKEKIETLPKIIKDNIKGKKILYIIGPEGGISPEEEEKLVSSGMTRVSLGNRIMRVETAAIYMASILNFYSLE